MLAYDQDENKFSRDKAMKLPLSKVEKLKEFSLSKLAERWILSPVCRSAEHLFLQTPPNYDYEMPSLCTPGDRVNRWLRHFVLCERSSVINLNLKRKKATQSRKQGGTLYTLNKPAAYLESEFEVSKILRRKMDAPAITVRWGQITRYRWRCVVFHRPAQGHH